MPLSRWLVFGSVLFGPRQDVGGADKHRSNGGGGKGMYQAANPLLLYLSSRDCKTKLSKSRFLQVYRIF